MSATDKYKLTYDKKVKALIEYQKIYKESISSSLT